MEYCHAIIYRLHKGSTPLARPTYDVELNALRRLKTCVVLVHLRWPTLNILR